MNEALVPFPAILKFHLYVIIYAYSRCFRDAAKTEKGDGRWELNGERMIGILVFLGIK